MGLLFGCGLICLLPMGDLCDKFCCLDWFAALTLVGCFLVCCLCLLYMGCVGVVWLFDWFIWVLFVVGFSF